MVIEIKEVFKMNIKWGFLRETDAKAKKAGKDIDTGLHRTGLEVYLKVIFPKIDDWIHDKALGIINGTRYKSRLFSEKLLSDKFPVLSYADLYLYLFQPLKP